MNPIRKHIYITEGPSKDVLFDCCKYAYGDKRCQVVFTFHVSTVKSTDDCDKFDTLFVRVLRITSITHKNSHGNSFYLEGFCEIWADTLCTFYAEYDAEKHEGTFRFVGIDIDEAQMIALYECPDRLKPGRALKIFRKQSDF